MLRESKTVAVVGMSDKTTRASHHIGKYLADRGYHVMAVNPMVTVIEELTCYPDLDTAQAAARDMNGGKGVDLVDVFRASEHVAGIVADVIRLGIPYLWLQDGVVDQEAIARAEEAGVKCVQNDCIFRRHAQMRD